METLDAARVIESNGDWPGVEVPAIEVRNEGDDAAEVLSISDALIGGEEPSGEGFGGELLELLRAKLSREGSDLGLCGGGALVLPLLFATTEDDELFDFGASRRCFFTGDFIVLDVEDFPGFSRELSFSRSELTDEVVDEAFAIIVVVWRKGGGVTFFSGIFEGESLTSSISISSSESSTLSADFTLGLIVGSLAGFALVVFAAADLGGLPIGPFGFPMLVLGAVDFFPFFPIIREIASFCVGFPAFAAGCEDDRAIDSPPALLPACRGALKGSVLSVVTVMLGGAGFGGSLAG